MYKQNVKTVITELITTTVKQYDKNKGYSFYKKSSKLTKYYLVVGLVMKATAD